MTEKNYIHKILSEGVDLLTSPTLKFPRDITNDERILFIQRMIKFFESKEDYLKCARLEKPLYKYIKLQKQESNGRKHRIKNSITGSQIT